MTDLESVEEINTELLGQEANHSFEMGYDLGEDATCITNSPRMLEDDTVQPIPEEAINVENLEGEPNVIDFTKQKNSVEVNTVGILDQPPDDLENNHNSSKPPKTLESNLLDQATFSSSIQVCSDTPFEPQKLRSVCEERDFLEFQAKLVSLSTKVYEDLRLMQSTLSQDYSCILEVFEEFWKARSVVLQESIQKADKIADVLEKAKSVDAANRDFLFDHLKANLNTGRLIKKRVDHEVPASIKELLKKFICINYENIENIERFVDSFLLNPEEFKLGPNQQPTCDPFLVMVTCVIDPVEFYVVRWCDKGKYERISRILEKEAHTYSKPFRVHPGKLYAVLSKEAQWRRGLCIRKSFRSDGESFTFTFVDEGHSEDIPAALVRNLPENLQDVPALALQCTLNHLFKRAPFKPGATAYFKQVTQTSPMCMKIFGQEGGILNVDLAQLPNFEGDNHVVSLRDALFFESPHINATVSKPVRVFQPKYDLRKPGSPKITYLRAKIAWAINPSNIYINILDDGWTHYLAMDQELQRELANPLRDVPVEIRVGHTCAVNYNHHWYRALVEEVFFKRQVLVFLIDNGNRFPISLDECYHLPDRFMELPAQTVRCVLHGLTSTSSELIRGSLRKRWQSEANDHLRRSFNKNIVISVSVQSGHAVGKLSLPREFSLYSVVYVDGETTSLNQQLCVRNYATTNNDTTIPNIEQIRRELTETNVVSSRLQENKFSGEHLEASWQKSLIEMKSKKMRQLSIATAQTLKTLENSGKIEQNNFRASTAQSVKEKSPTLSITVAPQKSIPFSAYSRDLPKTFTSCGVVRQKSAKERNRKDDRSSSKVVNMDSYSVFPAGMPRPINTTHGGERENSSNSRSRQRKPSRTRKSFSVDGCADEMKEEVYLARVDVMEKKKSIQGPVVDFKPIEGETYASLKFAWCHSPNAIFCRTEEMSTKLSDLMMMMREKYANSKLTEAFSVNGMCVVFCEGQWQRAYIIGKEGSSKYRVYLPDQGLERTVKKASSFRPIEPEFQTYPKLVLCVSLYGIYPPCQDWDMKVKRFLTEQLLGANEIKLFCRKDDKPLGGILPGIMLYTRDLEGGHFGETVEVNLNEELIRKGYAATQQFTGPIVPVLKPTAWMEAVYPSVGHCFRAKITWMDHEGTVYLQDVKNESVLTELSAGLANDYENTKPTNDDLNARCGDVCIARADDHKWWYRGVVLRVHSEKRKAEVACVDYGFTLKVDLRNIRLNVKLVNVPLLCVHFKVHNGRPFAGDTWDRNSLNEIRQSVVEREYTCVVVEEDGALSVLLQRDNGVLLTEELAKRYLMASVVPSQ